MKIATWNVNGFRACSNNKGLLDFVQKVSPDILCLQETKVHPDQLTESQKQILNHDLWSICGTKKGYSGTAIFSKKPCLTHTTGMGIKKFDWEGRILTFELEKYILVNMYFPNGAMTIERHNFKQEFLHRLPGYLKDLQKKTKKGLIIVGDYNVAYQEQDVHSPKTLQKTSGFLPEERQWFKDFLSQGYLDVYRYFYPDQADTYTWWSMREKAREKNLGWRIDHICVSLNIKDQLQSIKIYDQQMGSDHCPVVMTMK